MCVNAKLTTSSPTIWEDWRGIRGDLDSYFERVAHPCSPSVADSNKNSRSNRALPFQQSCLGKGSAPLPICLAWERLAGPATAGQGRKPRSGGAECARLHGMALVRPLIPSGQGFPFPLTVLIRANMRMASRLHRRASRHRKRNNRYAGRARASRGQG